MTFIKRERNDHRSLYHVVSAVLSKLSWAAATSLCIYFQFIYAPKHLVSRKTDIPPLLIIHLIGAYSIYLACVHNILILPDVSMDVLVHFMYGLRGLASFSESWDLFLE